MMKRDIDKKLEKVRVDYITKKQAIAIAADDRNLKDVIYRKGLKNNLEFGLIIFEEFGIKLVKYGYDYAWYIKVLKGEYGATKFIKIPIFNIRKVYEYLDGYFDEESNISCLVLVTNGEFIYLDDSMINKLEDVNLEEYKKFINSSSFLVKK